MMETSSAFLLLNKGWQQGGGQHANIPLVCPTSSFKGETELRKSQTLDHMPKQYEASYKDKYEIHRMNIIDW